MPNWGPFSTVAKSACFEDVREVRQRVLPSCLTVPAVKLHTENPTSSASQLVQRVARNSTSGSSAPVATVKPLNGSNFAPNMMICLSNAELARIAREARRVKRAGIRCATPRSFLSPRTTAPEDILVVDFFTLISWIGFLLLADRTVHRLRRRGLPRAAQRVLLVWRGRCPAAVGRVHDPGRAPSGVASSPSSRRKCALAVDSPFLEHDPHQPDDSRCRQIPVTATSAVPSPRPRGWLTTISMTGAHPSLGTSARIRLPWAWPRLTRSPRGASLLRFSFLHSTAGAVGTDGPAVVVSWAGDAVSGSIRGNYHGL